MEFDFSREPGKRLDNKYEISNDKPLVSIITAYYNAGKYFDQTFNSIINQTFPYFEWIIVNDGSTEVEDVKKLMSYSFEE